MTGRRERRASVSARKRFTRNYALSIVHAGRLGSARCVVLLRGGAGMDSSTFWTWVEWAKANGPEIVAQSFWWLVLLAVFGVLIRLKTIAQIIRDFNSARGPIWDLRGTVNQLKELEPVIRQLGGQMSLLDEKVDAARKQVTELQVESVSGRTNDAEQASTRDSNGFSNQGSANSEDEWEKLREYWRRNTQRIEFLIDQIPDGRTRLAFDRMPRTNYKAIIDRLEAAGRIDKPAANASRELIELFNRYRPRNQKVPGSVVGPLEIVDRQLDDGLVEFSRIAAMDGSMPPVVRPANQNAGYVAPSPQTTSSSAAADNIVVHRQP